MPSEKKPYRTYRTTRLKPHAATAGRAANGSVPRPRPLAAARLPRRRRWSAKRRLLLAGAILLGLFGLLAAWAALGYLAVSGGIAAADRRLPADARRALARQSGSLLSTPTTVLLLGSDHSGAAARADDDHSDSIMLLHTDPAHHRLVYLSIPRDLLASIPGYYETKINAAMQLGGPALAIRTIAAFAGLPVNHVAVVDFDSFTKLVDAVGGVTIDVPENILSDSFDCPYSAARCESWPGWRFQKGVQHMDGRRALIYSRIRVNQLNPADSDATRALHQQQVMEAVLDKLASFSSFLRLPFDGGSLARPLTTDLSTWQLLQLGWVKFRASTVLHCRLGGSPDGEGNLIPSPQNALVVREALGRARPRPPAASEGIYAPGCVVGNTPFPAE